MFFFSKLRCLLSFFFLFMLLLLSWYSFWFLLFCHAWASSINLFLLFLAVTSIKMVIITSASSLSTLPPPFNSLILYSPFPSSIPYLPLSPQFLGHVSFTILLVLSLIVWELNEELCSIWQFSLFKKTMKNRLPVYVL